MAVENVVNIGEQERRDETYDQRNDASSEQRGICAHDQPPMPLPCLKL
jgi:hypothetical protein